MLCDLLIPTLGVHGLLAKRVPMSIAVSAEYGSFDSLVCYNLRVEGAGDIALSRLTFTFNIYFIFY